MAAPQVSPSDRLGFTVFLAMVFHAVVVLGIGFSSQDPQPAAQTMDVTLAQSPTEDEPEEADFLADVDQRGSGTLEERAELTTTEQPPVPDRHLRAVEPLPREEMRPEPPPDPERSEVVATEAPAPESVPPEQEVVEEVREPEPRPDRHPSLMERSREIASLEARLSDQRNAYAQRPRVTPVTSVSTMRSVDAAYVRDWQRQIERVGNLNYPEQARQRGLHGKVRMLVGINSDGTVREVEVLQSSGHSILDDAAKRIVRQASPFEPFSEAMLEEHDVLEIIRTWSFQRRGLTAETAGL